MLTEPDHAFTLVAPEVVHDLIGIKQGENPLPEEHMIECVCELLQAIGYTLDVSRRQVCIIHRRQCKSSIVPS